MAKLIRNRLAAADSWQLLKPGADGSMPPVPAEADLIVPLALWLAERASLSVRAGRTGVWLDSKDEPQALVRDLGELPLIAVNFPAMGDGRGYSTARLLRERYGYKGEIRAIGDVILDLLPFMERCGFDAMALRDDQDLDDALKALNEMPDAYAASVDQPQPLFRRRLLGG